MSHWHEKERFVAEDDEGNEYTIVKYIEIRDYYNPDTHMGLTTETGNVKFMYKGFLVDELDDGVYNIPALERIVAR